MYRIISSISLWIIFLHSKRIENLKKEKKKIKLMKRKSSFYGYSNAGLNIVQISNLKIY